MSTAIPKPQLEAEMDFSTRRLASSGSHGSIESSSHNLHSYTRIMAATAVIGLVIEAMRKIVSRFMGAGLPNDNCAERLHMNVVMTADERDEPRHVFTLDVSGQNLVHSVDPRLRKTCHSHVQLLALYDWRWYRWENYQRPRRIAIGLFRMTNGHS
jgi:hypothetical protein